MAPLADAAKEAPAIPSTDAALLERLPLKARFTCDIAEFLLYLGSIECASNFTQLYHFSGGMDTLLCGAFALLLYDVVSAAMAFVLDVGGEQTSQSTTLFLQQETD
jgi:hypothetical protein